jgi:gliding motility-associated-like protein
LIIYQIDVADVNQEVCVPWNGIDGLGDQMAYGSASIAPIIISYEQGVYHFPIYDAEYLLYGFVIHAERPAGPNPKIFYDDRNITTGSGVGLPKIQLAGCDAPCHSWSTFITAETPGFGNLNTINTWWIIDQLTQSENIPLYYSYEKQFDIQLCPGELVIVGSDTLVADSVHTLQYTTFDGCDSILIYDIKEDEPEAAIVGRDLITCEYPLIELDGSSSNTGDQGNYLWFTNNGNIISPSNQAIIEINGAGDYILEASIESTWTGSTCTNYDTIVVDIDTTAPIIRIDHPGALKCNYKVLPIGAELIGDNLSYSWNTSDGNLLSSQTDIPALIDQAGVYSLVAVNDSNKCITIRDVIIPRDTSSYIQLNGPGVLDLEFCTSQPVQIQMIPSDAVFDSIRWNQSDGLSCDDCLDPIVSTLFSNNYLLAVTDTNGCRAYHPLEVRVDANLKIFVPNAFSPNNDGVNDVFKIYSSPCTVDILSFQVFDRWGAKMFEAYNYVSDEDVGWDGIMEGKTMDPAVFSWYLLAIGADGKETLLEGDVNLLR